ncbi:small GTP-binding protein [Tritrichomonas foetus]|uniref:Small GTP-binding protein n=1 Tax=Tritrichomonas foetus TaxID=1144522 RepID=A0A1J4KWG4_9EUKA|nr:small GTP-binding protein [Tritrichomonas foetus]|eukprot:OHT15498.1 small GTP-binding protein [Tritrichomonas foetus]
MQEFKFIIVGESGVGKSCILLRMKYDTFQSDHDVTIGVTFMTQMMQIGSTELKLQLWDTAGQEIFRSITQSYYRESHCAIIVYDISNANSFSKLSDWIRNVRDLAPADCTIAIVGNKSDLSDQRQVSTEEGRAFAESHGFPFFETSALTGENVQALFEECALIAFTNFQKFGPRVRERRVSSTDSTIWIEEQRQEKANSCC